MQDLTVSNGGRWWVARALAVLLPAVTMVTASHGACVVQPVSVGLRVRDVKCVERGSISFSFFLANIPPLSAAQQRRALCKLCFNDAAYKQMRSGYIKYHKLGLCAAH